MSARLPEALRPVIAVPGLVYSLVRVVRAFRPASESEEKSLQPLRSTTSAAEAKNCAGVLTRARRPALPEPQLFWNRSIVENGRLCGT